MPAPAEIAPIIEALFNRRDLDGLTALWTEDFRFEGPGVAFTGRDRMVAQEQNLWTAFPDLVNEAVLFAADDRCAAIEIRLHGTHDGPLLLNRGTTLAPTGQPVDFTFSAHIVVHNGLMASERVFYDTAGFFRQLGSTAG